MNIFKILLITAIMLASYQAKAGFITTNESELDTIFSQSSFGSMPIDIRIGLASELVLPDFLDITTDAEVNQLFDMHIGGVNVVNFYFIDTISACGGLINVNYVGCGEYFGNDFVVESSFAAGSLGGELLAHELSHNLGLDHRFGGLMNPSLNNDTTLNNAEVASIRSSALVQTDGQNFWIDITPVLIVASASQPLPVPEPSTLILFIMSFTFLIKNAVKRNNK